MVAENKRKPKPDYTTISGDSEPATNNQTKFYPFERHFKHTSNTDLQKYKANDTKTWNETINISVIGQTTNTK